MRAPRSAPQTPQSFSDTNPKRQRGSQTNAPPKLKSANCQRTSVASVSNLRRMIPHRSEVIQETRAPFRRLSKHIHARAYAYAHILSWRTHPKRARTCDLEFPQAIEAQPWVGLQPAAVTSRARVPAIDHFPRFFQ